MKKIVIAGSAKLQDEIKTWISFFENKNYKVLDYPKKLDESRILELYPKIHKDFLENVAKTDILFVLNEDKNGHLGYIGYEAYAELLFGLSQKLLYHKNIELVILKMPGTDVGCYGEICLWLELGWIRLYEEKK